MKEKNSIGNQAAETESDWGLRSLTEETLRSGHSNKRIQSDFGELALASAADARR